MRIQMLLRGILLALMTVVVLLPAGTSSAHGHIEVGDYELTIGFQNEPAYEDEPPGLELAVRHHETGEPVNGLESTLEVEIINGSSTKTLRLEPAFGEEGAYTAFVIPTEAGDYTWHIFGMIADTPVDVSMTSSPDTFSPVESKTDYLFPGEAAAQTELAAARQMARWGLTAGIAGSIFGIAGLAAALSASKTVGRKRSMSGEFSKWIPANHVI